MTRLEDPQLTTRGIPSLGFPAASLSFGEIRPQVLFRRRTHQPNHDARGTRCCFGQRSTGLRRCRLPRGHSSAERPGQDHRQHPAGSRCDDFRELYALDEATPIFGLVAKTARHRRCESSAPGRPGGLGARSSFASHDPARHGRIRRANELKRPAWRRRWKPRFRISIRN